MNDINNEEFDNIKSLIGYEQFEIVYNIIFEQIDDKDSRDKIINALRTKAKFKYNKAICKTCNNVIISDAVVLNDKETQTKSASTANCNNQTDLHSLIFPAKFIVIDNTPIEEYNSINSNIPVNKNEEQTKRENDVKKKVHKIKRHSYLRPHAKKTVTTTPAPRNGLAPKAVKSFNDSIETNKRSETLEALLKPSPRASAILKKYTPIYPKPDSSKKIIEIEEITKTTNNNQVFDNLIDKLPSPKDENVPIQNSNSLNSEKLVVNSNNLKLVKINGKMIELKPNIIINTMPKNKFKFITLPNNKVKILTNDGTILRKDEIASKMLPSISVPKLPIVTFPSADTENNLEHSSHRSTSESSLEPSLKEVLVDNVSICSSIPDVNDLDQYVHPKVQTIERSTINNAELLKLQMFREWQMCNTLVDGFAPIHNAIISNNIYLLKRQCAAIKSRKLDMNILDIHNRTPLELSISNTECSAEVIEMLLLNDVDVNVLQDESDNTMLHVAVIHVKKDIKKFNVILNALKHKIDDYNNEGYTALHYAINYPDIEKVESLLKAGADVNKQDRKSGKTALFLAVEADLYDIVQCLLKYGSDINVKNYYNMTIFDALTELDNVSIKTKNSVVLHVENVNKRRRPNDSHKKLNSNYKKRKICANKTSTQVVQ